MRTIAILAAAGRGERLMGQRPKMWVAVAGRPLIYHALACIERVAQIDGLVVMAPADSVLELRDMARGWGFRKVIEVHAGGERRQDTVRIALEVLPPSCEIVVVHDAARPLASKELFERVIFSAKLSGAATAAIEPVDTIVKLEGSRSIEYLDRSSLRVIQTPQAFKVDVIREAHKRAKKERYQGTDDAGLVQHSGRPIEIVKGDPANFKITYPEDLVRLESFIVANNG